jgi:hypothetical protein
MRSPHGRRRREQMLAVDELDSFVDDETLDDACQTVVETLVSEVVLDERHAWSASVKTDDLESVIHGASASGVGKWLQDDDMVATLPEAARQLVRAPPAAAAHGRKCIGGDQDAHAGAGRALGWAA